MNALANSQAEEIGKFPENLGPNNGGPTFARYTGQESSAERQALAASPPDILLSNFMMLELILTRYEEVDRRVVDHCQGLEFLVMDELHTYRGRQGADVAMLVRRLRQRLEGARKYCGLSDGPIYAYIRSRHVVSAIVTLPGNRRGRRLINRASLDAFIESYVVGTKREADQQQRNLLDLLATAADVIAEARRMMAGMRGDSGDV